MKIATRIALALSLAGSAALAGEMSGVVKEVDVDKHMVTLEDGTMVMTAEGVMLDSIMMGDKVMIMTDDKNMATSIEKEE